MINGTYKGATITSIAVSSKNIPIKMYESCIMINTPHGDKFHFSTNKVSIALPAPKPSNTAPKVNAAKIIHINIQETPSVFLRVVSITFLLNLFL